MWWTVVTIVSKSWTLMSPSTFGKKVKGSGKGQFGGPPGV